MSEPSRLEFPRLTSPIDPALRATSYFVCIPPHQENGLGFSSSSFSEKGFPYTGGGWVGRQEIIPIAFPTHPTPPGEGREEIGRAAGLNHRQDSFLQSQGPIILPLSGIAAAHPLPHPAQPPSVRKRSFQEHFSGREHPKATRERASDDDDDGARWWWWGGGRRKGEGLRISGV
ncbi:hypothetical protein CEXT_246311 [Caerostris extrusa]|uniref:Uncharacterized protein n=1 Tax=Caerostris extrusa TaxID=172846 RepID=A0AAV4RAV3_CAEEX|nr:hypothetical protein CEXT_246311 [Caerostris extrusa]